MITATQEEIDDFFLEHFGTKGMQWGVRRDAKRDVGKLNKINKKGGRGVTAARAAQKQKIEEKSANNPVYAKKSKKESNRIFSTGQKAAAIAVGSAYVLGHPSGRKVAVKVATHAGNAYRRLGESSVQKFLRKNAYSHPSGRSFVDVTERTFGALGKGVNSWNAGYPK